ncbi:MAG TPA: alcohol dehydrogenase catalytic domain-containing protein [Bauldia sp.]|nr:alcohol dehydrogenase catalytic domain-containing protein [Bauldia sp.]
MYAAVFGSPREIHGDEREQPMPQRGEVRVAVQAAGVCAGDIYIYNGTNPYVSYPRVGGHEIAGIVDRLGPETEGPAPGTPVVVEPFIGCGHCYPCRVGKPNCCANLQIIGVHRDGGFADYVVAPVDRLHLVPRGLSPFTASFAEPVAIGVQACRRGAVTADDAVLVLGAGPIGLALVEVARARGAMVFVTDIDPQRLATAVQLGGTALEAGGSLVEEVMRRTGGEGMPVVIEATGNPKVMESTVDLVAAGGRIVIVGLVKKGVAISLPGLDLTRKEMTIVGSRASVGCFPESLDLLARGMIRYPDIAEGFALHQAPSVVTQIAASQGDIHKAVLINEPG